MGYVYNYNLMAMDQHYIVRVQCKTLQHCDISSGAQDCNSAPFLLPALTGACSCRSGAIIQISAAMAVVILFRIARVETGS